MEPLPVAKEIASKSLANWSPTSFDDSKSRFSTPHIRKLNLFILPLLTVHLYLSYHLFLPFVLPLVIAAKPKSGAPDFIIIIILIIIIIMIIVMMMISRLLIIYQQSFQLPRNEPPFFILPSTFMLFVTFGLCRQISSCFEKFNALMRALPSNWRSFGVKKLLHVKFHFASKNPDKMPSFLSCHFVSISFQFLYK